MSEANKLEQRFNEKQQQGLVDMKFCTGEVSEATPEDFCKVINQGLDLHEQGKTRKLIFGDSQAAA